MVVIAKQKSLNGRRSNDWLSGKGATSCLSYISGPKIVAGRLFTHLGRIVTEDKMRDKKNTGKHGNSGRCLFENKQILKGRKICRETEQKKGTCISSVFSIENFNQSLLYFFSSLSVHRR